LTAIVVVCSLTSVGAFLLDVAELLAMPFTITAISLPALVLTLALSVWAGRVGRLLFLRRLYAGFAAGLVATLAYDAVRGAIMLAVPGDFNPFRALPNFGALILDTSAQTTGAHVAGWLYHFWNGISFAVNYALVAGGARFYYAFVWAMFLETMTLLVYPNAFAVSRSDAAFVGVSFVGHAVYGTTMGVLCRQWLSEGAMRGRPWSLAVPDWKRALA